MRILAIDERVGVVVTTIASPSTASVLNLDELIDLAEALDRILAAKGMTREDYTAFRRAELAANDPRLRRPPVDLRG